MTRFHDALARHALILESATGIECAYCRDPDSILVLMWTGDEKTDASVTDSIVAEMGMRSFFCHSSRLVLNGNLTVPQSGDRIVFGTDNYEVMPLANQGCYESQGGGYTLRIFTKKVQVFPDS